MADLSNVLGKRVVTFKGDDGQQYTLRSPRPNDLIDLMEDYESLDAALRDLKGMRKFMHICFRRGGHTDMTEEEAGELFDYMDWPVLVRALAGQGQVVLPNSSGAAQPGSDSSGG